MSTRHLLVSWLRTISLIFVGSLSVHRIQMREYTPDNTFDGAGSIAGRRPLDGQADGHFSEKNKKSSSGVRILGHLVVFNSKQTLKI